MTVGHNTIRQQLDPNDGNQNYGQDMTPGLCCPMCGSLDPTYVMYEGPNTVEDILRAVEATTNWECLMLEDPSESVLEALAKAGHRTQYIILQVGWGVLSKHAIANEKARRDAFKKQAAPAA